jgi:hypothetical protein
VACRSDGRAICSHRAMLNLSTSAAHHCDLAQSGEAASTGASCDRNGVPRRHSHFGKWEPQPTFDVAVVSQGCLRCNAGRDLVDRQRALK